MFRTRSRVEAVGALRRNAIDLTRPGGTPWSSASISSESLTADQSAEDARLLSEFETAHPEHRRGLDLELEALERGEPETVDRKSGQLRAEAVSALTLWLHERKTAATRRRLTEAPPPPATAEHLERRSIVGHRRDQRMIATAAQLVGMILADGWKHAKSVGPDMLSPAWRKMGATSRLALIGATVGRVADGANDVARGEKLAAHTSEFGVLEALTAAVAAKLRAKKRPTSEARKIAKLVRKEIVQADRQRVRDVVRMGKLPARAGAPSTLPLRERRRQLLAATTGIYKQADEAELEASVEAAVKLVSAKPLTRNQMRAVVAKPLTRDQIGTVVDAVRNIRPEAAGQRARTTITLVVGALTGKPLRTRSLQPSRLR